MKKIVRESLTETWVSSDTGLDRYYGSTQQTTDDSTYNVNPKSALQQSQEEYVEDEKIDIRQQVLSLIPPASVKITPEEFNNYVDNIIERILPENPTIAVTIFQETLIMHPYIKRKPIGFNQSNPYEPVIQKFYNELRKYL